MTSLLRTTLVGFFVGIVGTGAGGLMAFFIDKPSKQFSSAIIGLSSGLMMAIVAFELLPEAFLLGGVSATVVGFGAGAIMAATLDGIISNLEGIRRKGGEGYIKTGILLGIGIALHNFPEGLAIGSGFVAQERLGLGLSIVIALHNLPEGTAMVTPMRVGGISKTRAFLLTLLAGTPMGVGAYMGGLIGNLSFGLIGVCLAFAGGTMLYITFGELMPRGKELHKGNISTYFAIMGFMMGILISKRF